MRTESIDSNKGVARELPQQEWSLRRRGLGMMAAGLLIVGSVSACEGLGKSDSCDATMEPGDQGTHVIHLPGGTMLFSQVEFEGNRVVINAGNNALSPKEYTHIVTAEALKEHPTVRYEATPAVQVAFHVTEDAVTTSCIAKPA